MGLLNPLVTVLMPIYNGEKYLVAAIESVLNQTFTNFELLILKILFLNLLLLSIPIILLIFLFFLT